MRPGTLAQQLGQMARRHMGKDQAMAQGRGLGLRDKLLMLLLAFGAIPLAVAIAVGYTAAKDTVTRQGEAALRQLVQGQAVHLATELNRERLLLRTIAGQLPVSRGTASESPARLAQRLIQGLPEGGVFDGLRIVEPGGRILASVALRHTAPHWPPRAPAAAWDGDQVVVHRAGGQALAYLLAARVGDGPSAAWLEGHVRTEDFRRVFAIPEHLMEGGESAILEGSGEVLLVAHEHAQHDLAAALPLARADTAAVLRATVAGAPSLVALAPVPTTDWVFAVALPLDVALAPLARLRNAALLSSLVFVVLVVLTATWAARSVTTPLAELAAQAGEFVRTGVHRPLPARGGDEVGALVETFNRMWGDLEASRHEIERLHAQILARAQQLATVGELASGVAHEIRNPLTSVLGALDLALQRLPPGDAARPLLEEAGRQLRRIETTTQQLLRYARPPELREVRVDANELVKRAAQLVAPQAAAAGVALRVEPAVAAVPVRVDPELMVQVLVNLLLNGIEAMSRGGDLLMWAARHAPEVWIGVRDTGPGVPADRRANIFRPFFTTKHTGTGLGLPISRQIVERHGGSLRLEDTPGGGATFVVALPLAEAAGGPS